MLTKKDAVRAAALITQRVVIRHGFDFEIRSMTDQLVAVTTNLVPVGESLIATMMAILVDAMSNPDFGAEILRAAEEAEAKAAKQTEQQPKPEAKPEPVITNAPGGRMVN